MKIRKTIIIILALVFVAAAASAEYSKQVFDVLKIVNRERIKNGCEPLSTFDLLQKGADIRCEELPVYFSHTRPDGSDCFTVFEDIGIYDVMCAGENIAYGQDDAEEVMAAWMNSPGHRANILHDGFRHVGIGYYQKGLKHWEQLFYTGCEGFFDDCRPVSITLSKNDLNVQRGTKISDMDITLIEQCSFDGRSVTPLIDEMCTGYNRNQIGEQTVTVHYYDLTTQFTVNVLPEKVKSITLNKQNVNVTLKYGDSLGKTVQLSAVVKPDDALKELEWTSSDDSVAAVDTNGLLTVTGVGKCTITAKATDGSGVTAKCAVKIDTKKIKSIKISGKSKLKAGAVKQLKVKIKPASAYNQNLKWKSSKKKIATVDENGLVTALKKGKVTITAVSMDGTKIKAQFKITVQ